MSERAEARNISMYEKHWRIVDKVAECRARDVGGKPNASEAMRVIVQTYENLAELSETRGQEGRLA